MRIALLIVDDEISIDAAFVRAFAKKWSITICTTGAEALEVLESPAYFDSIGLDLMLGEIGGLEIYARLERAAPARRPRVFFMTAAADHPLITPELNRIGRPVIAKPFDLATIEHTVLRIVEESRRKGVPRGPTWDSAQPVSVRPPPIDSDAIVTEVEERVLKAIGDRVRYPELSEENPYESQTGSHLIIPNEPSIKDLIVKTLTAREKRAALELAAGRWATLMRVVRWGWWRAALGIGAYGIGKLVEFVIGLLHR